MKTLLSLFYLVFFLFIIEGCSSAQDMNSDAAKLFNKGNEYLRLGEYQKAIETYNQALIFQDDYRIYYQRGIALKKNGRFDEAEKSFNICLKRKPDFAPAYNALKNLPKGRDKFYISSFQDTKAGEYPKKRDSFVKTETPVVVILGNKGKLVTIQVFSISSTKRLLDYSEYIPEQNINTYKTIPLRNLTPDSYKVLCVVEGVNMKTLFFSLYD